MDVERYWKAALRQDADGMRAFFHEAAHVDWHNTNERFTVEEFIRANCEYPGRWNGSVERIEENDDVIITVTHVYSLDKGLSFHVTSFFKTRDGKILSIDEYWGDDGMAPKWRLEKQIGSPIYR